ncbi:MAG: HEAT repeat domain-containing protein [Acidobacteriota bacterium]
MLTATIQTLGRWSGMVLLPSLILGCGTPDPTQAAVQQIIDDLAAQRFGQATARYRTEEKQVLSDSAANVWRRALEHEDATVREWAIDALSRIGDPEDIAAMVVGLDDPFRKVQEAAAEGLIRLDPETARETFMERLKDADRMKKIIAAQSLGELQDPRAVPLLIEQLIDSDLEPGTRGVIAQALARLADSRAAAPLADLALDASADVQLRRNAAEALATLEGPAASAALQRLLSSDDPYMRDLARRAGPRWPSARPLTEFFRTLLRLLPWV